MKSVITTWAWKVIVTALFLQIGLCLSPAMGQATSNEFRTVDGFLERDYVSKDGAVSKAIDGIFAKCLAAGTTILDAPKGIIRTWGVGDKDGNMKRGVTNWGGVGTVPGLDVKPGGTGVHVKMVENPKGLTVGFKIDDGDAKSCETLHNILAEALAKPAPKTE